MIWRKNIYNILSPWSDPEIFHCCGCPNVRGLKWSQVFEVCDSCFLSALSSQYLGDNLLVFIRNIGRIRHDELVNLMFLAMTDTITLQSSTATIVHSSFRKFIFFVYFHLIITNTSFVKSVLCVVNAFVMSFLNDLIILSVDDCFTCL